MTLPILLIVTTLFSSAIVSFSTKKYQIPDKNNLSLFFYDVYMLCVYVILSHFRFQLHSLLKYPSIEFFPPDLTLVVFVSGLDIAAVDDEARVDCQFLSSSA